MQIAVVCWLPLSVTATAHSRCGSDPAKVLMSIMLPLMPQLRACFARCEVFGRGPAADVRVRRQPDGFPDWRPLVFPPGRTVMERRLAAILMTDMVGYSRLIGLDEEGTIARQKAHRDEIIDP